MRRRWAFSFVVGLGLAGAGWGAWWIRAERQFQEGLRSAGADRREAV